MLAIALPPYSQLRKFQRVLARGHKSSRGITRGTNYHGLGGCGIIFPRGNWNHTVPKHIHQGHPRTISTKGGSSANEALLGDLGEAGELTSCSTTGSDTLPSSWASGRRLLGDRRSCTSKTQRIGSGRCGRAAGTPQCVHPFWAITGPSSLHSLEQGQATLEPALEHARTL